MTEQRIRVWAASEQGIENDQPLETFPATKPAREVLEVLRQHYSGNLMRKDDDVTLIGDDVITAGDYVYCKTQGAAASGARSSGSDDMESGGSGHTVTLKFTDAAGMQRVINAHLYKGRLNRTALTDFMAGKKLLLLKINNDVPNYDSDGYTTQKFKPGDVVELTTVIRPVRDQLLRTAQERCAATRQRCIRTCSTVAGEADALQDVEPVEAAVQLLLLQQPHLQPQNPGGEQQAT